MTDPSAPLGDLVSAHFLRVEVALLSRVLTATLAGALPASMVQVDWRRTLADRLARRPGYPVAISIVAADRTLTFRAPADDAVEATISQTVRGVVLSRTPVTTAAWLAELGAVLSKLAAEDEAARVALERALLT